MGGIDSHAEDWSKPNGMSCFEGADSTKCDSPQQTRVPVETTVLVATCGANQAVLCCGLTPAFGCVDSGASWMRLPCRPSSAAPCSH